MTTTSQPSTTTVTATVPPARNEPTQIKSDVDEKVANLSAKRDASWPSVLFYIHLNILGLYGIMVLFTNAYFTTVIFTVFLSFIGIIGVTCGAHRLWAHQTYEANTFLRLFLMLCQTMAGQGSIYDWVQYHRLHHRTFKTSDDPYYSEKDFLHAQVFAHIRNLSPKQEYLLKQVDMKDLEADKIVMFQKKFYWILYLIFFVLLPINAPLEYWDDSIQAALFVTFSLRYLIVLNISWLITSAHFIWGLDKKHKPSDSNMIFLVTKSYWPQYHYLLPFDYQTGEFGNYGSGCTTALIRVFAALGLAENLKTMTSDACKVGLSRSVDTGCPLVDCLTDAGKESMERLPRNHYLNKDKYF
ncbi:acyl-CoA Delta-9 desaturase [Sitodiplosis mosellana]|uniref:Acyl-CoA Delta-9 desaturase 3 n=1 Tax=Sitodiplosis mosellana TaxID=263140 RepID=A0AA50IA97_9DIPT|nr:acyl-CoA Delta-9 desaturase [Sitodiplosis mosellana]WLW11092.1 Acyl-CoA Delta-9 desaturase 3 [Sitodiplosis mosellana]